MRNYSGRGLCYLPKLKAERDSTNLKLLYGQLCGSKIFSTKFGCLTICTRTVNVPCEIWRKGNIVSSCQPTGSSRLYSFRFDIFHDCGYYSSWDIQVMSPSSNAPDIGYGARPPVADPG